MSVIPQPKKKRVYQKFWFWFIIIFCMIAIIGVSIAWSIKALQLKSYNYLQEKVKVERRTLHKTISATGQIAPDEFTELYFLTSGTIKDVKCKTGDEVKKGDVLIVLDPDVPTFDSAKRVKAPFDGRIISLHAFVGDVVNQQTPAAEIGFLSTSITFLASDAERIDLKVGQKATYTITSYNNGKDEFEGKVMYVSLKKEMSMAGQTAGGENGYRVKLSSGNIPSDIAKIIGLSVDAIIEIDQKPNVLSLEMGAVQYNDSSQAFVYLFPNINDDFLNKAKNTKNITEVLDKKNVEIGFQGNDYIEITKGLKDSDEVLLYVPVNSAASSLF